MIVVRCPESQSGQRLVSERWVRSMDAVPGGFLLTVLCPCGATHPVAIPRVGEERVPA